MSHPTRFFILTGDPGVGKTTLTNKITSILASKGVNIRGFITEEVRRNGVREGFDVVTYGGTRGRLARDQSLITSPTKHRVGKYGVLIQEFEDIALPCLDATSSQQYLLVIDEIGKMELFSDKFKQKIRDLFGQNSISIVLATIPIRKSDALIEGIRNHPKAKVWTVTRENRNKIHENIINEMKSVLTLI